MRTEGFRVDGLGQSERRNVKNNDIPLSQVESSSQSVTEYPRAQELCESRGGRPGLPISDRWTDALYRLMHSRFSTEN